MSDERLVMALLAEGNPAVELDDDVWTEMSAPAYLATIERRSREMTKLETRKVEERRRPATWWVVAAVTAAVLGVAVILINTVNDDTAPLVAPSTIPLEGADDDPAAVEAFSEIEAAFHAHNTGDPAWVGLRHRGSESQLTENELAEGIAEFEEEQVLNPRIEASGCVSGGFGVWPSVVDSGVPPPTGYYFTCEVTETNDFYRALGYQWNAQYKWVVADGEILAVASVESAEDMDQVDAHLAAFREWLGQTHPDAVAAIFTSEQDLRSDGYAEALDYVDEFVAQSDVYPIETSGD